MYPQSYLWSLDRLIFTQFFKQVFAETSLILSISGLFELSKQFSGVGFNFPADKDISNCIAGYTDLAYYRAIPSWGGAKAELGKISAS